VQKLLVKFMGILHNPVKKIMSVHCTSYVKVNIIHQQIVHKVWLVFQQIQQNCASIYMLFPVMVDYQLDNLNFVRMEV
jgi:hypothetical protein